MTMARQRHGVPLLNPPPSRPGGGGSSGGGGGKRWGGLGMRILVNAIVQEDQDGNVHWALVSGLRAEAMGLGPINARGTVGHGDDFDPAAGDPEAVSLACELLAARLGRVADSAAWSHSLF